jgi:hypothetical protein
MSSILDEIFGANGGGSPSGPSLATSPIHDKGTFAQALSELPVRGRYRADFQNMEFNFNDESRAFPLFLRCPRCHALAELVCQTLTGGEYWKHKVYFVRCSLRACGMQGPTLESSQKVIAQWSAYYSLSLP